jgi:acyl-CoA synthetase (AMP-forming)/AMP-acid ligase II
MIENRKVNTLVELLQYQAIHQPTKKAYIFLADGKEERNNLTYFELDKKVRAVARKLQILGATGERALLLYPPGLEFIVAFYSCLYAGVIAVPVPPPDATRLKRTLPRIQSILKDAQASLMLTTSQIHSQFSDESYLRFLIYNFCILKRYQPNWQTNGKKQQSIRMP